MLSVSNKEGLTADIRKMEFLLIKKEIVCVNVRYAPVGMLIGACEVHLLHSVVEDIDWLQLRIHFS